MQYRKIQNSSSSFTNPSCRKMALYRWIKTESRWNKKLISLSSPDWSASLRPSYERKTGPDALIGPNDSTSTGWKMWWAWMFEYFGQRTDNCWVPSQWLSSLLWNQRKTIRPLPIGSAKTKWLFGTWNASRDHSPGDLIIQGVVPGRSTRSFLLTNKAVQSVRINQGPTMTFMWHVESSPAADLGLLRFSLLHHQASTHMTIQCLWCPGWPILIVN